MHLKSVEMVGFKSFADKTTVELKPGVSAVVGPNGCGKSNIVDALRWCLGEMSAKSLRSKHMMDVIFSGASGRAPLNLAEVTLCFDNAHRLLPIDFSEVQVTRRLYRSGESEYFLNRTQCRLKDIRELFLDTGIEEGYAILAQGEVDFVMNAKPEDRRELFEEAAGVSKYKARREESLRKLERVETDISRLNDMISLVKEQMESLESAARKARLFQKLKEELKSLEISDALHRISGFDEQIRTLEARLAELRAQTEKATVDLDCKEAEITRLRVDQDEREQALYQKNLAILELDKAINAADNLTRTEAERETELRARVEKAAQRSALTREEEKILRQKRDEARAEIESLESRKAELEAARDRETEAWKSLSAGRQALESEERSLSQAVLKAASEAAQAVNEKNASASGIIHKETGIRVQAKELEKARAESQRVSAETGSLETQARGMEQARVRAEEDILSLKTELEAASARREELRRDVRETSLLATEKSVRAELIRKNFETDPYRRGAQAVLNQGFPGLRGVVGLLLKYSENMARWVESALGDRLHYLVFDRLDQAKDALDWLRQNRIGRAACLVLEKLPDVQPRDLSSVPNANSLLTFVSCPPELEPMRRFLLGSSFIAGNSLYSTGVIDGGSDVPPHESDRQAGNDFRALEELDREVLSLKEKLAAGESALKALEEGLSASAAGLSEKQKALDRIAIQAAHLAEVLSRKVEEARIAGRESELLENELAAEKEALEGLVSKMAREEEQARACSAAQAEKEAERAALLKKISDARDGEHQAELAAKEHEVRLETFMERHQKSAESLQGWEDRLGQCLASLEDTDKETRESEARIEESVKRQNSESRKVRRLESEKKAASAEVEELLAGKAKWEADTAGLRADIDALREKQAQAVAVLHQAEIDLRGLQNERDHVRRRVQETYQVDLADPALEWTARETPADDIDKIKRRVESMSNSVNLEAPEQHETLTQRYQFLAAQTQDLEKARQDLRTAISQINATTKEHFRETFAKVRENFRSIYSTLFQGGEADLVFTNEQDLLETGIDIVAQPPGKKLQNIALLSGGEKALTAIALLFAFFMVRPSPFCVLDEVDAPWDPANVNRFLNLLKEFSQKTQFLVVTHNPRTMEMADILYGVTMQEFGISKVLSAKLKKEPHLAENVS